MGCLFEHCACLRPLHRVAAWFSSPGLGVSPGTLANSLLQRLNPGEPEHGIPIAGDVHNGTATLKNAVSLYRDFRKGGGRTASSGDNLEKRQPRPGRSPRSRAPYLARSGKRRHTRPLIYPRTG